MDWTLEAVAAATGGRITAGSAGDRLGAVTTDSRGAPAGSLFVPIRARRDGHDFVADAVAAGAAAYLIEAGHPPVALPAGAGAVVGVVEVADTGQALLAVGRAARSRIDGEVVGVTGSVGKTSTKDLAAAALAGGRLVAASERSFNNELGVPLTLANAPAGVEVAIVEMGARGPGHVALLCDVARPTMGVVTAVAGVHTEMFGSVDAVAKAKSELVEALPPSGTAVLNADDPRVAAMAGRTRAAVLGYSAAGSAGADVAAAGVQVGPDLRASFRLLTPWGSGEATLAARGAHQVGNALAAATVALACGVAMADVLAALASATLSAWRMELSDAPSGAAVLNDAYNANPTSVEAALRSLATLPAARRVAVLGAMTELGDEGPAAHLAAGRLAGELGIELVAVGTAAYGVEPVAGVDEALGALGPLGPGDAVLVKGSRVTGLERLADRLLRGPGR